MKKEIRIWICDRCKAERQGETYPTTQKDNWGKLKIDQTSGFDSSGCAWAPRIREPLLLCGKCIDDVVSVINTCPGLELAPGCHTGCTGTGGDCPICGK